MLAGSGGRVQPVVRGSASWGRVSPVGGSAQREGASPVGVGVGVLHNDNDNDNADVTPYGLPG